VGLPTWALRSRALTVVVWQMCRHGGMEVSEYLHKNLHQKIEECKVEEIPQTIDAYRGLGGYLKRYRGGPLERFREPNSDTNDIKGIALDEAAVLAFLEVRPRLALSGLATALCADLTSTPPGRQRRPSRRIDRPGRRRRHRCPDALTRCAPHDAFLLLLPPVPHGCPPW